MRIVDDDVSWTSMSTTKTEKEEEEDDGDLPVVCIFWGCEDFEMQASQSWLPVQGRLVRGKVEGREEVTLSRSYFKGVFFAYAYTQSLYMEGSICLETGTDHREAGFLSVGDRAMIRIHHGSICWNLP